MLTVAHCVQPGADYKIVQYDADRKPQLQDVKSVAIHPGFRMQAMLAHRATADVALLQLEIPAKGKIAGAARHAAVADRRRQSFTIAGIGVTVRGDGKSGGIDPCAGLVATGQPGTLADSSGRSGGAGRTRRDLAPAPAIPAGRCSRISRAVPVIIGVISWSTGPNGSAGCGGLTGVTPLTLYRDWILQTARQWGFAL